MGSILGGEIIHRDREMESAGEYSISVADTDVSVVRYTIDSLVIYKAYDSLASKITLFF